MGDETKEVPESETFSPTTFNLESTMETVMDSESLFRQIAEMLIDHCPDHIDKIKAAITDNNSGALEREAHSLKGAVGNFGADDAYEAAYHLEKMGKNGEMALAGQGLSNLESVLAELISEMKIVLRRMSG